MSILKFQKIAAPIEPDTEDSVEIGCEQCRECLASPKFTPDLHCSPFFPFNLAGNEVNLESKVGSERMENGIVSGSVRVDLPDGASYEGEVVDGQLQGWGKLYEGSRLVYTGQFLDNRFEGFGQLAGDSMGSVGSKALCKAVREGVALDELGWTLYAGLFRANERQGRGCLEFGGKGRFFGDFVGDRAEGVGVLSEGAEVLVGVWRDGVIHAELSRN